MTPAHESTAIQLARRVFGWLLHLAPRHVRETYGDDMTIVFVERCARASSRRAILGTIVAGWTDVVVQSLAQRVDERRRHRRGRRWGSAGRGLANTIDRVRRDARSGWRAWKRTPLAGLTLITLLALGMGGATALFGPLYALVLAPLPLPRADELVRIGGGIPLYGLYFDRFEQRDRLDPIFSNVAAFASSAVSHVSVASRPQTVSIECVTPEFFETIGVAPALGRSLLADTVTSATVVLSDRAWEMLFNRAQDAIGKSIQVGSQTMTVAGVMPAGFSFPERVDLWLPMRTAAHDSAGDQFIARLRSGVSIEHAAAGLLAIGYQRGVGPTGLMAQDGPPLQRLQTFLRGDVRPLLWQLWIVALLFLLLACAGAANVLLAHGVRRRTELSVRLALGAERGQLVRQLLTETLLLVGVSGMTGLWISHEVGRWLRAQWPALTDPSFLPATLGLAAALAGVVTIACGLAPAFRATGGDIASALKCGAERSLVRRATRRLSAREVLAGVQLTTALALAIGTGLLGRSLLAHLSVPLGFDARDVAVLQVELPPFAAYDNARQQFLVTHHLDQLTTFGTRWTPEVADENHHALEPSFRLMQARNVQFFRDGLTRLRALPDVATAGVLWPVPFTTGTQHLNRLAIFKSPPPPSGSMDNVPMVAALRGGMDGAAIDALRLHLVAGRRFTAADETEMANAYLQTQTRCWTCKEPLPVAAIVNVALAQKMWPNEDPMGRYVGYLPFSGTVVGVVANFQQNGEASESVPAVYLPFVAGWAGAIVVKLRPGASPTSLRDEANRVLGSLIAGLPPIEAQSMEDLSTRAFANLRLALRLLAGFAILGILVAALGVYALATLMAAERTREMAIRAALGAGAADIRSLALWRSARVLLLSIPLGLGAGWMLARGLSHLLYKVGVVDAATYAISASVLAMIALLAGLSPAWRLAAADPIRALRQD